MRIASGVCLYTPLLFLGPLQRARKAGFLDDLKSQSHLLRAREQNLGNIPRERRWVPRSRIRQQDTDLARVLEAAAEIQQLLEDLIRRSGLVSQGDAAADIGDLINKLYQQSHSGHLIGDPSGGPAYHPYQPGQFEASPEAAAIVVFIALRALGQLFKRAREGTASVGRG